MSLIYPSIDLTSYMKIVEKSLEIVNALLVQLPKNPETLKSKGKLLIKKVSFIPEDQKTVLEVQAKMIFENALRKNPQDSSAWLGFTEVMSLQFTLLHDPSAP